MLTDNDSDTSFRDTCKLSVPASVVLSAKATIVILAVPPTMLKVPTKLGFDCPSIVISAEVTPPKTL